jgi:glycosyltransferase involved in cell wall biosynthesis
MLRRVTYVLGGFPRLSETFIAGEIAEVLRRGIDVRILSLEPPIDEPQHELVANAGLVERTTYQRGRFRHVLRDFRPDLLHAHFARSPTASARELAGEFGLPFTFTAHRYDIYAKPPPDFGARAAAAAAVVTVSNANASYIVQTFGVPPDRITVIPCGVDTDSFRPDGTRPAPPEIVCVARLKPFKNQRLLLDACALLRSRGVEFRCVLVGEGPCRDELEAQRRRLGLEGIVELVGAAVASDVLRWWQRAAVAVLPSESEGMPVCLMEAAACAVPAVATAVGGNPELVADGRTGLIVPPGDSRALAGALERLLREPALARRLGEAARRRAKEQFSVVQQVDRLLAVWNAVLSNGRRT